MQPELKIKLWPKQAKAFFSRAREILFGGAAGGGKSHLLRIVLITWCALIPGLQCYLFRRHYKDVIMNHMEGPTGFREMLDTWIQRGFVTIVETEVRFWNGSRIYLCHCSHAKHLENYRGAEIHVFAVEEATQFPAKWIKWLRHRVRMPAEIKDRIPKTVVIDGITVENFDELFPRIYYTSNPGGESHNYFKRYFVKAAMPGDVFEAPADDGGFQRQFILSLLEDNPAINLAEYEKTLEGIGDPELVKMLRHGNWDAITGNYFSQYNDAVHCVADFAPPEHWFKFRTFDWGSSDPFAVYWWCVSDGEEFTDHAKRRRWFPRGSLIAYREWYGCTALDSGKGLELRNQDVADGIVSRTGESVAGQWLTVTDSLPFQDRGMGEGSKKYKIADVFEEHGVPLIHGNCARIHGWTQMRDRLQGIQINPGEPEPIFVPLLYITERCPYAKEYIPSLARHETKIEDAVESGEATHSCDAIRLACTTRPLIKDKPPEADLAKPRNKSNLVSDIVAQINKHNKGLKQLGNR